MGDPKRRTLARSAPDLARAHLDTGDPDELEIQIHVMDPDGKEIATYSQAEVLGHGVDKLLDSRRGGAAPTRLIDAETAIVRLVIENPRATAPELWKLIPESHEAADPDGGSIYRDGDRFFVLGGGEAGRTYSTFLRYVTEARKKSKARRAGR